MAKCLDTVPFRCSELSFQFQRADPTRRPMINYDQVIQQGHITMRMREMLLDWLVDVAYDREISDEGLHLAVSYVDRFLSMNSINRNRLQLLGVTALFVASKYEERSYLSARKLSDMTNRTYTAKEVVVMEANILRDLDHKLGGPTAITFVRTFLSKCRGKKPRDKRLELMCSYLAELSLLDAYYIRFLPSMVAAACLFVAKFTINPKTRPWNLSVQRSTGYRVSDIEDCIRAIHDLQRRKNRNFLPEDGNVSNLTAVRDKYERDEFERVATIAPPKTIRASFLKDREYVNG
uniref:Uncharacterized protein n=2 Tax=Oryza brachyantha TaxID=4533 RepID=J3LL91_ORYBR